MHTHSVYSMDDEALLDTSDDENTTRETPLEQTSLPATFSRYLVDRFRIIGHHNISSETINQPENQKDSVGLAIRP